MPNRMLIDANHDEETRVIVLNKEGKIQEFDIEAKDQNQIRGNIYLAKVTRVEPSLQAAFVEYGGNRQGFLAFSEIHPDYYRIPVEDKKKLLAEASAKTDEELSSTEYINEDSADDYNEEELKKIKRNLYRNYKIQEVIARRQILLVQVVKEERGTKGAALTTYISIAGRYCVLMPNTPRGGGVSRKIANITDRKRLKKIVDDLDVADGMAVIIRTAGSKRTKTEIKRDFSNSISIWENVKKLTLESNAPFLIHEEGSLIKRAIRDLYNSEIDEVLVEGSEAYKVCKNYMKAVMPSHAKKVQQYNDDINPLFQKFKLDSQLQDIFNSRVNLKSGGYGTILETSNTYSHVFNTKAQEITTEEQKVHGGIEVPELAKIFTDLFQSTVSKRFTKTDNVGNLPTGSVEEQVDQATEPNLKLDEVILQSAMTYNKLFSLEIEIVIPGDYTIRAGTIIHADFPQKDAKMEKGEDFDKELSGLYICADVCTHLTQSHTMTKMRLVRDSYGRQPNRSTASTQSPVTTGQESPKGIFGSKSSNPFSEFGNTDQEIARTLAAEERDLVNRWNSGTWEPNGTTDSGGNVIDRTNTGKGESYDVDLDAGYDDPNFNPDDYLELY